MICHGLFASRLSVKTSLHFVDGKQVGWWTYLGKDIDRKSVQWQHVEPLIFNTPSFQTTGAVTRCVYLFAKYSWSTQASATKNCHDAVLGSLSQKKQSSPSMWAPWVVFWRSSGEGWRIAKRNGIGGRSISDKMFLLTEFRVDTWILPGCQKWSLGLSMVSLC